MFLDIFNKTGNVFFSPLAGENRDDYAVSLSILYEAVENTIDDTISRKEAVELLEDYFETNESFLEKDLSMTPKEKARDILLRLVHTGWLIDERDAFETKYVITEKASKFKLYIDSIDDQSEVRYSSESYSVYTNIINLSVENGREQINLAHRSAKSLFKSLSTLNGNLQRYHQDLLDKAISNSAELLKNHIQEEYIQNFVDRAYRQLTEESNPTWHASKIIKKIENVDEEFLNKILKYSTRNNPISSDDFRKEIEVMQDQLDAIKNSYGMVTQRMNEISNKSNKYLEFAIGRYIYLMKSRNDMVGDIHKAIENINSIEDFQSDEFIINVGLTEDTSLFKPQVRVERVRTKLEPVNDSIDNTDGGLQEDIEKQKMNDPEFTVNIVSDLIKDLDVLIIDDNVDINLEGMLRIVSDRDYYDKKFVLIIHDELIKVKGGTANKIEIRRII